MSRRRSRNFMLYLFAERHRCIMIPRFLSLASSEVQKTLTSSHRWIGIGNDLLALSRLNPFHCQARYHRSPLLFTMLNSVESDFHTPRVRPAKYPTTIASTKEK